MVIKFVCSKIFDHFDGKSIHDSVLINNQARVT